MLQTCNFEWSGQARAFLAYSSDLLKKESSFRKLLQSNFTDGVYLYGTQSKKKCFYTLDRIEEYNDEIFCWILKPESRIGSGTVIKIFNS